MSRGYCQAVKWKYLEWVERISRLSWSTRLLFATRRRNKKINVIFWCKKKNPNNFWRLFPLQLLSLLLLHIYIYFIAKNLTEIYIIVNSKVYSHPLRTGLCLSAKYIGLSTQSMSGCKRQHYFLLSLLIMKPNKKEIIKWNPRQLQTLLFEKKKEGKWKRLLIGCQKYIYFLLHK